LLAVSQDESGRLAPVPGWLARPSELSTAVLVERIRAGAHQIDGADPSADPPTGSLEIVTVFRELRAATLFPGPGAWRLRPVSEHERIEVPVVPGRTVTVERILDLPDATTVAVAHLRRGRHFVRLRESDLGPAKVRDPEEIIVLGSGARPTAQTATDVPVLDGTLTSILARALDTGGATNLPFSGQTLDDLLDAWYRTPPPTKAELLAQREAQQAARKERRLEKAARQAELRARLADPAKPSKPDPDGDGGG